MKGLLILLVLKKLLGLLVLNHSMMSQSPQKATVNLAEASAKADVFACEPPPIKWTPTKQPAYQIHLEFDSSNWSEVSSDCKK